MELVEDLYEVRSRGRVRMMKRLEVDASAGGKHSPDAVQAVEVLGVLSDIGGHNSETTPIAATTDTAVEVNRFPLTVRSPTSMRYPIFCLLSSFFLVRSDSCSKQIGLFSCYRFCIFRSLRNHFEQHFKVESEQIRSTFSDCVWQKGKACRVSMLLAALQFLVMLICSFAVYTYLKVRIWLNSN